MISKQTDEGAMEGFMKKIGIQGVASVLLVMAVALAGKPTVGHGAQEVAAWGNNIDGATNVPDDLTNVVAIGGGGAFSLALTAEGQVVAWGSNWIGSNLVSMTVPAGLSNVMAIAAAVGGQHALALTADGRVTAWGDNRFGQTTVPSGLTNVVAIAAGGGFSLALTADSQVVAWGQYFDGSNYMQMTVPRGLSNVVGIAAGGAHSLALTAEGRVVAWGDNWDGEATVPGGLSNVVAVSAGAGHSLALTAEGQLVAWGQLYDGSTLIPATVPGGLGNVVAIASGRASTLALTAAGQVTAWGYYWNGPAYLPATIPTGLSNAVAVASGFDHGLALVGSPPGVSAPARTGPRRLLGVVGQPFHHRIVVKNGAVTYGATGLPSGLVLDANTGVITGKPAKVGKYIVVLSATNSLGVDAWSIFLFVNEPALPAISSNGLVFAQLAAPFSYAVVVQNRPGWYGANGLPTGLLIDAQTGVISGAPLATGDFAVSLVASNRYGLGSGSLTISVSPVAALGGYFDGSHSVPNTVTNGLSNVVAVAAGAAHNLALTTEGRVVAWGLDLHGHTDVPAGLSNVVAVAAGASQSLALTTQGRVVAWGQDYDGTNYFSATAPAGLSNVVGIAAGGANNLALTAQGRVAAWGYLWTSVGYVPNTLPAGLSNVVAIAAGASHSLALTAGGRIVAWGWNGYGATDVPTGLSNVVAIAAGAYHSEALTASGQVAAWGMYIDSGRFRPLNVPAGLTNMVAIAAGSHFSLALTADGTVVNWGDNFGQVTAFPGGLSNVVAIAAGNDMALALIGLPSGVASPSGIGPQFLVAFVDQPFNYRVTAKNGITAYAATGLPSGLSLDPNTGLITGKPAQTGTYTVGLSATNSTGSSSWTVTLFVNASATPVVISSGVVPATLGSGFSYAVQAYNSPRFFEASGLPAGLAIDPQTGVISGVPLEPGDFRANLVAGNESGRGAGWLTIHVLPVVAWGNNLYGQTNVPSGLNSVVAIAAGGGDCLALTEDGLVVGWGNSGWGQTNVPRGLSNVAAVAVGSQHSLALTAQGDVVAWGYNYYGQTNVPPGLSNVVAIAAGGNHSLALTADGQVLAWGDNEIGQTNVPGGLRQVVAVAAGSYHSLALTAEGRVVAWGAGRPGTAGGVNYGQATVPDDLSNVVAIAAGSYHSLALTADGRVLAWGMHVNSMYTSETRPATPPAGLSNVVAIAGGETHSLALTSDGQVVEWGWYMNIGGRPPQPVALSPMPPGLSNVAAIAASGGFESAWSLALTGLPPGVAAPAWIGPQFLLAAVDQPFQHRIMAKNGVAAYGATGLPTGLTLDQATGLITGKPAQAGKYAVALSATNGLGSVSWTVTVFVNGSGPPAIDSNSVVEARWGIAFNYPVKAYNGPESYAAGGLPPGLAIDPQTGVISGVPTAFGDYVVSLVASNQHGQGTSALTIIVPPVVAWGMTLDFDRTVPNTLPVGLSNVVALAAGMSHTLALTAEGRVVAWGYGSATYVPNGLSNAVAIAAGNSYSLALTAEGQVTAWGDNMYGQTTVPSALSNVVTIAAGVSHSLALTRDGRVFGWGDNTDGQASVPNGLRNVVAIAAGLYHSLALTADGRVVAWGDDSYGQRPVPSGLRNVVAVAAGYYHSLALTGDGQVVAWGKYSDGPNVVPANAPEGLSNVVAIAAGYHHSLALTAAGQVVAWGDNSYGQTLVPSALSNVEAIAAGGLQSLALLRQPTVPTPGLELSLGMSGLEFQAEGAPGISCLLLRASGLPGPWLPIEPITFTNRVQRLRLSDTSEPVQFFRLLRK
jgi:alpha-tubulin suppressor-like RCC1 family protein